MKLNVALAQISPQLGNIDENLALHLQIANTAHQEGVQLLVFPELSLTGYWLREQAFSIAMVPSADDKAFAALLDASHKLDMVVGFVERDKRFRFFISSAYLSQGQIVHIHRKVYLPTYGMFDEGRYFAWGNAIQAFDTKFGRVGLLICEDFWHMSPPYLLWLDGADLLILTSSAPESELADDEKLGSVKRVELIVKTYASMFTNFLIHVNRTGSEDGAKFYGGSTVFGPEGNQIVPSTYNREGLFTAELDLTQLSRARIRLPLLRDERSELTARALRRILNSQ